jgi:hypothetical protein
MDGDLRWTNPDLERHDQLPLQNSTDRLLFAAFTTLPSFGTQWGLGFRHEGPTDR